MVHADVSGWRLRAAAQDDFDWAYELHKAALALRRARERIGPSRCTCSRPTRRAVALYEREGLRVVGTASVRLLMRSRA